MTGETASICRQRRYAVAGRRTAALVGGDARGHRSQAGAHATLFEGNEITGSLRAELAEALGHAAGAGGAAAAITLPAPSRRRGAIGDAFLSLGTSGVLFLANDG